MSVTPLYLGPQESQLFATLHLPDPSVVCKHGVLMCNPFGQEAIRTHRLFRVLADRLARNGIAAMRFEYFGTGDSAGDDGAASLTHWVANLELAHQALLDQVGPLPIRWFGPRLGANVALQALQGGRVQPESMVLWDPIVDGKQYAQRLNEEHTRRLSEVFRRPDFPWSDWQLKSCVADFEEASGFPVSADLLRQLRSIDLRASPLPTQVPCTVLFDPQDVLAAQWMSGQAASATVRRIELASTFSWTEHEVQDGAIVPAKALQSLIRVLGDHSA
jgi:pimeloyl-ACP methyl ester carboxylesterase